MRQIAILCLIAGFSTIAFADDVELKTVKARSIELRVPKNWKKVATTSSMRALQLSVPATTDDGEDADLVVFYFGGPTGGIKANVDRWIGQFVDRDRKLEMFQGKCAAGSYILVDTTGTWNKPDGPPFARKTVEAPNSRVINIILIEEKKDDKDYYFIKLSGGQEVVTQHVQALRTAIGADAKSEKPFALKDAEN